jgi:hypothetical protein
MDLDFWIDNEFDALIITGGYQQSNAPPPIPIDPWDFSEDLQDESWITEPSGPVGANLIISIAQPQDPEWDFNADDWGTQPVAAGYQQSNGTPAPGPQQIFEDAMDWVDDPDEFFADDYGNDDVGAFVMLANAGIFQLIGAISYFGLSLAAAVGVFSVTGGSVAFAGSTTLQASTGIFTLAGGNATLGAAFNLQLNCQPGVFSLSGGIANLGTATTTTLTCATGEFSLAGQAAALSQGFGSILSASTGAFSVTGIDSVFSVNQVGVYVWPPPSAVTDLPVRGAWEIPGLNQAIWVIGSGCFLMTVPSSASASAQATFSLKR